MLITRQRGCLKMRFPGIKTLFVLLCASLLFSGSSFSESVDKKSVTKDKSEVIAIYSTSAFKIRHIAFKNQTGYTQTLHTSSGNVYLANGGTSSFYDMPWSTSLYGSAAGIVYDALMSSESNVRAWWKTTETGPSTDYNYHTSTYSAGYLSDIYIPSDANWYSDDNGYVYTNSGNGNKIYYSTSGLPENTTTGATVVATPLSVKAASSTASVVYGTATYNFASKVTITGTPTAKLYTSSDETVATIDRTSGLATILKCGKTRLTCTIYTSSLSTLSAYTDLTVTQKADSISLTSFSMKYGETHALSLSSSGSGTGKVTYTSLNTSVGTVSGATLSAVGVGTVRVKADKQSSTNY